MDGMKLTFSINYPVIGFPSSGHANYRDPSSVALTACALKSDKERFLDAGMDDYAVNRADSIRLEEALKASLARRQGSNLGKRAEREPDRGGCASRKGLSAPDVAPDMGDASEQAGPSQTIPKVREEPWRRYCASPSGR